MTLPSMPESGGAHTWQHDRETGEHFLPIDDDKSWKAYRSAAGDYALTVHSDSAGHGGEVEYFATLRQAKKAAERGDADLRARLELP